MHKQRIIIVVAGVAGVLGALLPWVTAPIVGSVPGTSAEYGMGWIALGLAGVALVVASTVGTGVMTVSARIVSGFAGAGTAGIGIWHIVAVFRAKAATREELGLFGEALAQTINVGVGAYLVAASGLVIVGAAYRIHSHMEPQAPAPPELQPQAPSAPPPQSASGERPPATPHGAALGSVFSAALRGEAPAPAPSSARFWVCLLVGLLTGAVAIYLLVGPRPVRRQGDSPQPAQPGQASRCGSRGGLQLCVDGFARRRSIAGPFLGYTAKPGYSFVLVQITLRADEDFGLKMVGWTSFELRDQKGNAWKTDTEAHALLDMSGLSTFGLETVLPGRSLQKWLVFLVPDSALGAARLTLHDELAADLPARDGCVSDRREGTCTDVSRCQGTKVRGLCDGPASVQCCLR